MKLINPSTFVVLVILIFNTCSALPKPEGEGEAGAPSPPAVGENQPAASSNDGTGDTKPVEGDVKSSGEEKLALAPVAAAAEAPEECDTKCLTTKLSHQTTIIIFICIIVCVILLIVILFFCYFMKKLHGKALLTTDHATIIKRPTKTFVSPEEYTTKQTETTTIPGDNPNESRVITTTTTKIVSKTSTEDEL